MADQSNDEPQNGVGGPGDLIQVSVDQVRTYDHNPRITRNPRYNEIKASIRAAGGLTDPLPVVQRPGAETYMLSEGGNTRLEIVRELKAETADSNTQFDKIWVLVRPFKSELDLAALHERENAVRGDLTYFERCLSLYKQYQFFFEEFGGRRKQARFVRHMAENYGVKIDKGALSRSIWVVEELQQIIPTGLKQGAMSVTAVRTLQTFLACMRRVWLDHTGRSEEEYDDAAKKLLLRQEKDHQDMLTYASEADASVLDLTIDYDQLKDELVHEIYHAIDDESVTHAIVINRVDAALHRLYNTSNDVEAAQPESSEKARPATAGESPTTMGELASPLASPAQSARGSDEGKDAPSGISAAPEKAGQAPRTATSDLDAMRRQAFAFAAFIAKRHLTPDIITPISTGYGFLLTEMLEEDEPLDEDEQRRIRTAAWWALALGGGVLSAPRHVIEEALPEFSVLRQCLVQGAESLVVQSMIGKKFEITLRIVSDLPEDDFQAFHELFALRRRIHLTACRSGDLWNS